MGRPPPLGHGPDVMSESAPPRGRWSRRLLALYPRSWRERYGAEMADLVARQGLSFSLALDLLRGALDAHLHLPALLKGWSSMEVRARRSVLIVFAAAAVYAGAVKGLLETRDQVSFAASPAGLVGSVITDVAWLAMALAGLCCQPCW